MTKAPTKTTTKTTKEKPEAVTPKTKGKPKHVGWHNGRPVYETPTNG